MRRTVLTGAVIAALLVLIGGVSIAAANPRSGGSGHDGGGRKLRFDVEFSPFTLIDVGEAGPSLGDMLVFHDKLLVKGKQVGEEGGTCPIVDVAQSLVNCTGTVRLRAGQITFQGLATSDPTKHLAVTGGTGAYQGAGGQGTLVEFGNGKGSLTLELLDLRR